MSEASTEPAGNALIFIVEDEPFLAEKNRILVERWGYTGATFNSGEAALDALEDGTGPSVVLLDLVMPGMGGVETLKRMRDREPDLPIVVISGQDSVATAVEALQMGAFEYLVKPVDEERLKHLIGRAVQKRSMSMQLEQLREEVRRNYNFDRLIGRALPMRRVFKLLEKTLNNDISVLIEGESGTGKELVARAIHYNGLRAGKPLIVVNCAAIPRELVESELFGHEKGSFTGAVQRKIGKFELADGGTLFLDEIGELEEGVQAKLLRALQEREFERVGGTQAIKVDVRLVAATKRNLQEEVDAGRFREDLFYRINTFPIPLPPLRERPEDIPLLARHFLDKHARHLGREDLKGFCEECIEKMKEYNWPGNVRQMENVITRAMVLAEGNRIELRDLPEGIRGELPEDELEELEELEPLPADDAVSTAGGDVDSPGSLRFRSPDDVPSLETIKAWAVHEAYKACDGNVSLTAKRLEIGRATLYRMLEKFDVDTGEE
ncbi:response regulator [bacterium]|nr:response regulator [bacterium]